ncbi:DNA modification system-associated small protein [Clostridium kluyveri]|uniref:DNA modification system-associated small protein n=1 Tax=Clostridium kluyveri TaxID=1534 RepID=UPI0022471767|nr:DNA modification system-associated small protein [Clostridium kluyveri]UZQ50933.1 hypothetical protein OP486_01775 [Clostridium kluyveri]
MDDLLKQICKNYEIDPKILEQILRIEKNYVYKQKRIGITGRLREIIENVISEEKENSIDNTQDKIS